MTNTIKVWDWPVRLCHWGMALAIPAMWWTAENGEMGWHMRVGLALLFIMTLRIVWGFLGTRTARFASFVKGPSAILAYLRGTDGGSGIGHTPLGALSVLALLGTVTAQVWLGLFSGDPFDGATGPLNDRVGVLTADWMTDWHKTLYEVIFILIGLHLAAIAYYAFVKRKNLVTPMITGKASAQAVAGEPNSALNGARLAVSLLVSAGLVFWVISGGPGL